jgi:hypothetical protein
MVSRRDACVALIDQLEDANRANGSTVSAVTDREQLVSMTHTTLGSGFWKLCLPAGTGSVLTGRRSEPPPVGTRLRSCLAWIHNTIVQLHSKNLGWSYSGVELELFDVVIGWKAPPRSKKRRFGEWTSIHAPNFYYLNSIVLLTPVTPHVTKTLIKVINK